MIFIFAAMLGVSVVLSAKIIRYKKLAVITFAIVTNTLLALGVRGQCLVCLHAVLLLPWSESFSLSSPPPLSLPPSLPPHPSSLSCFLFW
jgi:hypothetical protein